VPAKSTPRRSSRSRINWCPPPAPAA
jgi:hypothetical protein